MTIYTLYDSDINLYCLQRQMSIMKPYYQINLVYSMHGIVYCVSKIEFTISVSLCWGEICNQDVFTTQNFGIMV